MIRARPVVLGCSAILLTPILLYLALIVVWGRGYVDDRSPGLENWTIRNVVEKVLPPPTGAEFVSVHRLGGGFDTPYSEAIYYRFYKEPAFAVQHYRDLLDHRGWTTEPRSMNLADRQLVLTLSASDKPPGSEIPEISALRRDPAKSAPNSYRAIIDHGVESISQIGLHTYAVVLDVSRGHPFNLCPQGQCSRDVKIAYLPTGVAGVVASDRYQINSDDELSAVRKTGLSTYEVDVAGTPVSRPNRGALGLNIVSIRIAGPNSFEFDVDESVKSIQLATASGVYVVTLNDGLEVPSGIDGVRLKPLTIQQTGPSSYQVETDNRIESVRQTSAKGYLVRIQAPAELSLYQCTPGSRCKKDDHEYSYYLESYSLKLAAERMSSP